MTPPPQVLKFVRSDQDDQYVLVRATKKGTKSLDLKLEATEGEAEYATTLKHDKVASLMVKNCPVSETAWVGILERLFRQESQPDIKATATVETDSYVSIIVRKEVAGITQRLGALTIGKGPEGQINVLDWCATAVDAGTECRLQATNSQSKMVELEDTVKGLKAQLEELIAAKEEDETAMLYKFRDLLNEKKLKIREQQKAIDSQLLGQKMSSATVDMSTAPLPPQTKKKAGASRPTKRKAQSSAVTEDTPESDETESMDVDKVKEEENDDEESGGETQTESVASTDDDSEDDNDVASRSHASSFNKPAQAEPPAPAGKKAAAQPPPKRSLPFAKSKPHAAAAQNKKGAESETDSDDEL